MAWSWPFGRAYLMGLFFRIKGKRFMSYKEDVTV